MGKYCLKGRRKGFYINNATLRPIALTIQGFLRFEIAKMKLKRLCLYRNKMQGTLALPTSLCLQRSAKIKKICASQYKLTVIV